MKLTKISPNILHFRAKNQRVLGSSFVRMQEFYECPMKEFRGEFFTLKEFKKAYAKKFGEGKFTYYNDWVGFNMPGRTVRNFWYEFDDCMTRAERLIKRKILKAVDVRSQQFYIVGTFQEEDVDHEIAHAMWYLDAQYKKEAVEIMSSLPLDWQTQGFNKLGETGYSDTAYMDEMNAYLSTSTIAYAMDEFGSEIDLPYNTMKDLQLHFQEYKGNLDG